MGADVTPTHFPLIDEIVHATARYLGALTVLDDEALGAPSALPGWSRAHVVAHPRAQRGRDDPGAGAVRGR